jgi:hypothetical protein
MAHTTLSSVRVESGAALQAEERKRAEYEGHGQGIDVVPFALEATGRIGPAASQFLEDVGRGRAGALKAFRRDVDHLCASFRGRILSACRQRLAGVENN